MATNPRYSHYPALRDQEFVETNVGTGKWDYF